MNEKEKLYTQQELDNILKGYVTKSEFNSLQKNYTELKTATFKGQIKNSFLANGGNEAAFEDFYVSNQEQFGDEKKPIKAIMSQLKEKKPFYVSNTNNPEIADVNDFYSGFDEQTEMQELLPKENGDLVEGTMYSKNLYKK